jgi:hypothetical protein
MLSFLLCIRSGKHRHSGQGNPAQSLLERRSYLRKSVSLSWERSGDLVAETHRFLAETLGNGGLGELCFREMLE